MLRFHRWTKRKKQWTGKNGAILSQRCRYCGTLKEEGKLLPKIIFQLKNLYRRISRATLRSSL